MRKIKLTKGWVNSISYEVVNVNSKTSVDECKIKKKKKTTKHTYPSSMIAPPKPYSPSSPITQSYERKTEKFHIPEVEYQTSN